MTAAICLFLISAILLIIAALLLRQREPDRWAAEDEECDALALEVGAGIFNAADWDIVNRETPRQFSQRFRRERTILAFGWIRLVRSHVGRLMRDHRLRARIDSDVKTADELKLAFEFLLFRFATGIMYSFILLRGPVDAARLLGWFLDSARKLRRLAGEVVPESGFAPIVIVKTDS